MATAIPSGQVTAFINIIKAYNPTDINYVNWLSTNLVYFSDIPTALFYYIPDDITWNIPLLTQLMACFSANDSDLQAAGIYVSKNTSFTNPVLLINSNDEGGGISITSSQTSLGILGNCTITGNLTISSSVTLGYLYVGSTVKMNILDSSASNANIGQLWIRYLQGLGGYVSGAIVGSSISNAIVDTGAYYGGILNDSPLNTCSASVTGLTCSAYPANFPVITHNTIPLYWTGTTGTYIKLVIQYKKSSSTIWLTADDTVGNYVSPTCFMFTTLDHDTYYDFQVISVCTNGGYGTPAQVLAVTTNSILPTPIG